jgi:hypothetical protein
MTTTLTPTTALPSPSRSSRTGHIEALFALLVALDVEEPQGSPNFTSAPAPHSPGPDWPPDQWG